MTDAVTIDRTFAAPISTLWEMWTQGEHFANWYGPPGCSIPVAELDLRPGGRRHVCMAMDTPDGPMQMWFVGAFTTIEEPSRLVYTETIGDADGNAVPDAAPMTEVTVELTAVDDASTRVVMTHAGIPADSPGAQGWAMAFDKLEALLAR